MSQVKFLVLACMFAFSTAANAANESNSNGSNAEASATPVVYVNGDQAGVTFTHLENGNFRAVYENSDPEKSFNIEVLPQEWGRRVYTIDSIASDSTGTTLFFKDSNISVKKNDDRLKLLIKGQKVAYTEIASQQYGYVQYYKGWTFINPVDAHHYFDYTPATGKPKANEPAETPQKPYKESKKDTKKAKKSQKEIDAEVAAAIGGFSSEFEVIED